MLDSCEQCWARGLTCTMTEVCYLVWSVFESYEKVFYSPRIPARCLLGAQVPSRQWQLSTGLLWGTHAWHIVSSRWRNLYLQLLFMSGAAFEASSSGHCNFQQSAGPAYCSSGVGYCS